jgi:cytochrome c oxidase subunit IV
MSAVSADGHRSVRGYLLVFGTLVGFTILTVAASRYPFALPAAIGIALTIAVMKGSMVAGVFMHLAHEQRAVYGALLLTAVFFIALLVLPILTMLDQIGVPR